MMKYCEQNLDSDSRRQLRPLALRPLLLFPGAIPRRRRTLGDAIATKSRPNCSREATEVKLGDKTGVQWTQGYIGPVYTTALNLIILQLDNACLPIYQR